MAKTASVLGPCRIFQTALFRFLFISHLLSLHFRRSFHEKECGNEIPAFLIRIGRKQCQYRQPASQPHHARFKIRRAQPCGLS